jgi:hypothetical protein
MPEELTSSPLGNYSFVASPGRPFSAGIVADDGYDLVHATFRHPRPLKEGLAVVRRHVEEAGRPVQAIAGFELRIPEPWDRAGFNAFNEGYIAELTKMGLHVDGLMPAARTNVAPLLDPPSEPVVLAFTYTVTGQPRGRAFLVAGATESAGDQDEAALRSSLGSVESTLGRLGIGWSDATGVQFYGESVPAGFGEIVLAHIGAPAGRSVRWFPSRPPITDFAIEIDTSSCSQELVLS